MGERKRDTYILLYLGHGATEKRENGILHLLRLRGWELCRRLESPDHSLPNNLRLDDDDESSAALSVFRSPSLRHRTGIRTKWRNDHTGGSTSYDIGVSRCLLVVVVYLDRLYVLKPIDKKYTGTCMHSNCIVLCTGMVSSLLLLSLSCTQTTCMIFENKSGK